MEAAANLSPKTPPPWPNAPAIWLIIQCRIWKTKTSDSDRSRTGIKTSQGELGEEAEKSDEAAQLQQQGKQEEADEKLEEAAEQFEGAAEQFEKAGKSRSNRQRKRRQTRTGKGRSGCPKTSLWGVQIMPIMRKTQNPASPTSPATAVANPAKKVANPAKKVASPAKKVATRPRR